MSKVLFLISHDVYIYNLRLEILERFLEDGHEVHLSCPYGDRINELEQMGVIFHDIYINRHGMNLLEEIVLLNEYKKLYAEVQPDIIFAYTIKPNIYGAIAAKKMNIPFIANITGLGTAVENGGIKQAILIMLYKYAFTKVTKVFFQNTENRQFFTEHKIRINESDLLPGSGVNLKRYSYQEYPDGNIIKFAFISRIMKEKGIEHYLEAAKTIKKEFDNVEFHVCGFCEEEYDAVLKACHEENIINYHGMINNVAEFMGQMHCIIHPTYYPEGISNVLLEASASGRPIITTDRSGCREVVDDQINGYMIKQKNSEELIIAIRKFLALSWEDKRNLGINARAKVEKEFDRTIVVEKYAEELKKLK